ncbi:MAG: uracil permease [Firmicutes bacterium]|nr:uracil permease [Bacillota bacterium]
MDKEKKIIGIGEKPPISQWIPLSMQHTFAMFSASVLVPLLFGIEASIVLLMNGVGTLLFIFITKGKSPAYLGSSFAFLAPAGIVISTMGYEYALGGFICAGAIFAGTAILIRFIGVDWIDAILPPAAMGPIVALIGLELAGTAASNGGIVGETIDPKVVLIFIFTLVLAIIGQVVFKGFASAIAILIAIVGGYAAAALCGLVDFSPVMNAKVLAMPNFAFPKFDLAAIIIIIPASLTVISEHISHQIVTSQIVDKDLIRDPGLHRSLLADGVSTMVSGCFGSVPTTTYGENIGVMAVTKVYSVWVIGGAAVFSIILAFFGQVSALINTIPGPVMGGISFLLYGMIAASGIRLLVDKQVDYSKPRNLAMTAVVFVTGLSGAAIQIGEVQLTGMCLATIVGIVLGLSMYIIDKAGLANDKE